MHKSNHRQLRKKDIENIRKSVISVNLGKKKEKKDKKKESQVIIKLERSESCF